MRLCVRFCHHLAQNHRRDCIYRRDYITAFTAAGRTNQLYQPGIACPSTRHLAKNEMLEQTLERGNRRREEILSHVLLVSHGRVCRGEILAAPIPGRVVIETDGFGLRAGWLL